jgi:ABC-2 type transport system ATP-binding protein
MSANHVIEVSHLVKRYKKAKQNSVDDVSFYVEEGAFFSLLGPNGAGKTTIISILTTLLSSTSGSVTIAGHDVERDAAAVRQQIGVIFQNPSLDQNLTAEENIRFHANLYNLYPFMPSYSMMSSTYKKKVRELSEVVGLEDQMSKQVKTLSGGMKRKLEIMRSLMHKPRVLFLDKPTTGLDPISRQNLWKYLQDIRKKEDTTIFLTTHYLEEAEGADYVCIIDQGKLVAQGSPTDIKETLIENYIRVDAEDRNELLQELKKQKLHYRGDGPFTVKMNSLSAQQVIHKIKTPLSVLEVHAPSLEDAYVEIISSQQNHAKS